jgi:hypothetical protein
MLTQLRKYYHPYFKHFIFFNVLGLIFVKLVFPQSVFQLATILDAFPVFDSREIIKATNEARATENLPALRASSLLDLAASEKLSDMAIKEYFAHTSPEGVTPWFWIKKNNYKYSVAGENLAIGFFTAEDTVEAWLNSPSHRANILNGKYREMGVAVKGVEIGDRKGILVVQMFGLPAGTLVTTSAQPNTTPIQPAPTADPNALPIPVAGAKTEELPTLISTDITIKPVENPVAVKFEDAENIAHWSRWLNSAFAVYTLGIAMLSIFVFFLIERSRKVAFRVAFNFALFFITILTPVSPLTFQGLIY